jgi:hypothetical protein
LRSRWYWPPKRSRGNYSQPVQKELIVIIENAIEYREFLVIHPLDDVLEQMVETRHLGSIRMTPAVRIAAGAARVSDGEAAAK